MSVLVQFRGIYTLHLSLLTTITQLRGIFAPLLADMSVLEQFKGIYTLYLSLSATIIQLGGILTALSTISATTAVLISLI
ncbi:hypothetical protein D3C78_1041480 [compost metagenome]